MALVKIRLASSVGEPFPGRVRCLGNMNPTGDCKDSTMKKFMILGIALLAFIGLTKCTINNASAFNNPFTTQPQVGPYGAGQLSQQAAQQAALDAQRKAMELNFERQKAIRSAQSTYQGAIFDAQHKLQQAQLSGNRTPQSMQAAAQQYQQDVQRAQQSYQQAIVRAQQMR